MSQEYISIFVNQLVSTMRENFVNLRNKVNSFDRTAAMAWFSDNQVNPIDIDESAEILRSLRFVKNTDAANEFADFVIEKYKNSGSWSLVCEVAFLYIAQKNFEKAESILIEGFYNHPHMTRLLKLVKALKFLSTLRFDGKPTKRLEKHEFIDIFSCSSRF